MKHLQKGTIVAALLLLVFACPLMAKENPLASFDKRDKFYDATEWNGRVWIAGYPGHLLHKSIKGGDWELSDMPGAPALFALAAFDENTAIAVGQDGLLLRTEDGGKSFKEIKLDTKNPLFDVGTVTGGSRGWVIGHFNTIFVTEDKGKTWTRQVYQIPEDEVDEPSLNAIDVLDAERAFIVGEFGYVLKTVDGGKTWLRVNSPIDYNLYAVRFLDDLRGAVAGAEGALFVTESGGETWTRIPTSDTLHLFDLVITSEKNIHVVGADGYYGSAPFAGEAERAPIDLHRIGVYTWLSGLAFVSDAVGYAVGGRGSILETRDGGKTWQQISGR